MNKKWVKTFYNKLIEAESNYSEKEIDMCHNIADIIDYLVANQLEIEEVYKPLYR